MLLREGPGEEGGVLVGGHHSAVHTLGDLPVLPDPSASFTWPCLAQVCALVKHRGVPSWGPHLPPCILIWGEAPAAMEGWSLVFGKVSGGGGALASCLSFLNQRSWVPENSGSCQFCACYRLVHTEGSPGIFPNTPVFRQTSVLPVLGAHSG